MEKDIYFMRKALEQAEKAYKINEVPVGAVIVKDGKIIARGYNKKETRKDSTEHAEISAIKKACKKKKKNQKTSKKIKILLVFLKF